MHDKISYNYRAISEVTQEVEFVISRKGSTLIIYTFN